MKKYAFTFSGQQTFSGTITKHSFLLRCMPGTYPFQRSYAHKLTVTPFTALTHITDVYGNEMCTGTIDKKHQSFSFTATGFVLCSKYLTHDPLDRLYLYPTRLTQPTEQMARLVSSASLPEGDWARAQALCSLTYRLLNYTVDSRYQTAAEAFGAGQGDAKDFAHVFLTLCRLSGLSARFVSGLALGLPQAHFWAEVYCGGVWRALDPCSGAPVEEGYLKIAHGPDYAACAVARSYYPGGNVAQLRQMQVQLTEHVIRSRDTVPHA